MVEPMKEKHVGNFLGWGGELLFYKIIPMSLIEIQYVSLMIDFDVWDRLGHV